MLTLKVLTLNCWLIPLPKVCKLKDERLAAIAEELQKGENDIVVLEEIWSQQDYYFLKGKLSSVYPDNHYWLSGYTGSGVCVFSKYKIVETFQHAFTLNGYPHKVYHGDWYAGKVVGLARIQAGEFKLNLFATHIHADHYSTQYDHHRVCQAFELSQFVKLTSDSCDAVIAAGDFNFKPDELMYKVATANGNLKDAWTTARHNPGHQPTSDCPNNPFYPVTAISQCLDYIFYRNNSGIEMSCSRCEVTMGRVPGQDFHYSDHEGVQAEFVIQKSVTTPAPARNVSQIEESLTSATKMISEAENKVQKSRQLYMMFIIMSLILIFLLMWSSGFIEDLPPVFLYPLLLPVYGVSCTCLLAVFFYCLWAMTILHQSELNSLAAVKLDMQNILKYNKQYL